MGNADFDVMEELAGDTVRVIDETGRMASRNIVQFVPMHNFLTGEGPKVQIAGIYLANEVLAEVPDQFLGFVKSRNIILKNPPPSYTEA